MSTTIAKLDRYIKDKTGAKVENVTRSVNITKTQQEFLDAHNINLSLLVRDTLDAYLAEHAQTIERKRAK